MNDYEHAIGETNKNDNFCGVNFSGFDNRGQRVMGVSKFSARRCMVLDDIGLIWPVPKHWSMEDAATVPLPYLLAYYCLTIRSQLMEGFTVLITDGASAFGQALISLCFSLQCVVYTTVSNELEKKLLLKLFPAITGTKLAFNHEVALFNVCAFEPPANRCQIVVNCGTRDLRQACLSFLSFSGVFLDVSDEDMKDNCQFGLYFLFECKNYISVRASSLFRAENIEERSKLIIAMGEGIAKGIVKPLTHVVYLRDKNLQEFHTISINQYKGSILFNMEAGFSSTLSKKLRSQKENNYLTVEPKKKTNFEAGLGAFFSLIKKDDFLQKESIIKMKTLTSVQYEEEINAESVHLIMIPGFEGHYRVFEDIAEKLKVAAVTLQLTPYVKYKSIQEIAAVHYKDLKMTIKVQSKFYILSYSFGVNVAIELAALMENEGHTGIIFCLDSSPGAIQVHLNAYVAKPTNVELQNAIIEHVYKEVIGQYSKELNQILIDTENEQDKITACLLRLRTLEYSNEYLTCIIKSTYKRMLLAKEYRPNLKLDSKLVLMRGISHPKADSLSEDYGLSKITKKPVKIINIDSDHALAPYDFKIASIINKMLSPKLLREFNNRNFCDTYFMT
ncbi:hypothetical protein K1T71_008130 [Dendrolimus kikuchii]|uniref:Uncharacterized protein n=1 Tax=Dendrolimus kikuchii TaxID=765133 RepID=A0ACC1CWJ2_9NEOP|nr:hypothetical protein K1T71_008130 [Dendrolimus kikuchii]